MSVALNSFKLLPLLQLDVGMKPFVQSGVFTETPQNELVAAAAHHAVPCSLRIARWGSAASRARLMARMRWYGARGAPASILRPERHDHRANRVKIDRPDCALFQSSSMRKEASYPSS